MFKWLKIPKLKLKKPQISDEFKQELGLIIGFCAVYVGIYGYDWRIANIICGIALCWFFFPRKG